MSLIERLKNPEHYYEFTDPKKANAVLMSLCQEAADALAAPVQKPYRPLQDNGSQYFGGSWDTPPTQPAPVQSCYCPNCEALSKELAAAQRQWVDLTNDEIALIHADNPHPQGFARAVLAKSKEKNNG